MPDYKKPYLKLFGAISDAMDILNKAQIEAEELYLNSCEEDEKKVVKFKVIENKDE